MRARIFASVGLVSMVGSTTALAVFDICDAFGRLEATTPVVNEDDGDAVFSGDAAGDYAGQSIATGDFNGDGTVDVVIGAHGTDVNGPQSGGAYLFFGPIADVGGLRLANADVALQGSGARDLAGFSVANAGDVDLDGIDDLLVGASGQPASSNPNGVAYLVSGSASFNPTFDLATESTAVFTGEAAGDGFGESVSSAGDFNNDGVPDVLIGALAEDTAGSNAGAAYVFFGPTIGTLAAASADVKFTGAHSESSFGIVGASLGDVSGDGIDDIAIGAPRDNTNGQNAGALRVYFGSATVSGTIASTGANATIVGGAYHRVGASVTNAGDHDGDGITDLWTGAKQQGSNKRGALYLIPGGATLTGTVVASAGFSAVLYGEDANDLAGSSVATGDFDADGSPDVLVGGERADGAVTQSGAAWIVHGPVSGVVNLRNRDYKIGGSAFQQFVGAAVATGDLNGDGFDDAFVGGWRVDNNFSKDGAVGLYLGGHDIIDAVAYYPDTDNDGFGDASGTATASCSAIPGFAPNNTDCNDGDTAFNPFADEDCSVNIDFNCDGFFGPTDHDGDGFTACTECNDGDEDVNPDADEVCGDSIDNDCDDLIDDATAVDAQDWFVDADADGYGLGTTPIVACVRPSFLLGTVANVGGDCNDALATVNPNRWEICNSVDDNCDGEADNNAVDALAFWEDGDGDGSGNPAVMVRACTAPANTVTNRDDCDDTNVAIVPGATEVCDYADNDCDGMDYLGGNVTDAKALVTMTGATQNEYLGSAVAILGDQNADGFDEFVVGAERNSEVATDAGAVFIQRGELAGASFGRDDLRADGNPFWDVKIAATRAGSNFGDSLATGDVNGDGVDDLLIGAPGARTPGANQGAVYLFFGPIADGAYVAEDADWSVRGSAANDYFGESIALGDLDGDGSADIIIGAPRFDGGTNDQGAAYLFYGSGALSGNVDNAAADAVLFGGVVNDQLGQTVAFLGDLDGDGNGDFAVAAPDNAARSGGAAASAGFIRVMFGGAARFSGTLTGSVDVYGTGSLHRIGWSMAGAGDITGDGIDDFLIGTTRRGPYLIAGSTTRLTAGDIASKAMAYFEGPANTRTGRQVAIIGDVNEDGFDDFALSAEEADVEVNDGGGIYLIYGKANWSTFVTSGITVGLSGVESFGRSPSNAFPTFSSSNNGLVEGALISGTTATMALGSSIAGGGDFDGDGHLDFAAGAVSFDEQAGSILESGAAYLFTPGPYGTDRNDVVALADQALYYWDWDADLFTDDQLLTFTSCPMHAPISFRDPLNPVLRGQDTPTADLDCEDRDHTIFPGNPTERRNDSVDSDCDGFDNPNTPPTATIVVTAAAPAADPANLFTNTDAEVTVTPSDADGDTVTYTISWWVDGVEIAGETSATLSATYFVKGQTVVAKALLDDGRGTVEVTATGKVVRNSKPSLTGCQSTPLSGSVEDPFMGSGIGATDPDVADTVTTQFQWQIQTGPATPLYIDIPGETAGTLAACAAPSRQGIYGCQRGYALRLECTPFDGTEAGTPVASAPINIVNAKPTITSCVINEAAPTTLTPLTVTATGSDSDTVYLGDVVTISYQWIKNGTDLPGETSTTLDASQFQQFDVIAVRCTPNDGLEDGTSETSAGVTILNTLPTAPVVDLTPNAPRSEEALTATITTEGTDIDNDPLTYNFYWTKDSSTVSVPASTTTINKTSTLRGEVWEVTARSDDGFGEGGADSDTVTIRNTKPAITGAVLSPTNPITTDDIIAAGVGWYDEDGDTPSYSVAWYKNTVLQPPTVDPLKYPAASTVRNDVIYAIVTPVDPFESGNPITTTSVTVINAKPTAPVLAIAPSPAAEADDLNCTLATPSSDADGDAVTYTYAWHRVLPTPTGPLTPATPNVLPTSNTAYAHTWYCTALPFDGLENGDIGTSPTVAIRDLNEPPPPTMDAVTAFINETLVTLTGTCTPGVNDCNSITVTCNDGVATTVDTGVTCSAGGDWTHDITLVRGRSTSCSAVCIDITPNTSLASNVVTMESCDPNDPYDTEGTFATTYGDSSAAPIDEWGTLADNNATNLSITANIVGGDTTDWYIVRTSDDPVADATANLNTYKFEIDMDIGEGSYDLWVYRDDPAGAAECATTGPYDDYSFFAYDRDDAGNNHTAPTDRRRCAATGSANASLYNQCEDLSADYYIRVLRTLGSDCSPYRLRVFNGRP